VTITLPLKDIQRNYCRSPRLIVAEAGPGGSGPALEDGRMEKIVAWRYPVRLPTVMNTNPDMKNLPERIFSRLCDAFVPESTVSERIR
jgi:hypothetical protein